MAHELHDMSLDEVSLVDAPANKGSRVLLFKRDRKNMKKGGSQEEGHMMDRAEKVGIVSRLMKSLGLSPEDVAKSEDSTVTQAEFEKAQGEKDAQIAKLTADLKIAQDAVAAHADVQKAADRRKAFRAKLPKNMQAGYDGMKDEEKDEFENRFGKAEGGSDPVAKLLTDATAENAELRKRLDAIEGEAAVAKVRAELSGIQGLADVDKTAALVLKLRKADPAAAEELVTSLKAGAERVRVADLFMQKGRDQGAAADAGTAIDQAAAALMKADATLTKEQAVTKAMEQNPALYTAYNAAKGQ